MDQIETDVRVTKDHQLVLIHDATVERTTNGSGRVCDFTLAELKALDAGNGEQIPTLRELLELVKDHPTITLDIELKEYPEGEWAATAFAVCRKTLALLEEYGFGRRCVINSFNGRLNEYVYREYGGRYKQHLYYPPRYLSADGCELPVYSFGYCACVFGFLDGRVSLAEIREFQQSTGIRLWAGASVKDEATVDLAVEMGAELITCNHPDRVLEILRARGLHP